MNHFDGVDKKICRTRSVCNISGGNFHDAKQMGPTSIRGWAWRTSYPSGATRARSTRPKRSSRPRARYAKPMATDDPLAVSTVLLQCPLQRLGGQRGPRHAGEILICWALFRLSWEGPLPHLQRREAVGLHLAHSNRRRGWPRRAGRSPPLHAGPRQAPTCGGEGGGGGTEGEGDRRAPGRTLPDWSGTPPLVNRKIPYKESHLHRCIHAS